jgi:NADH dehydrogenase
MNKIKKTKVVIVGGGFAGVKTALELANNNNFEIRLISKGTNFEYHGALYRTATGNTPLEVVMPLRELFAHAKNVEVILDSISNLKSSSNAIKGADGEIYQYDILVLALGNQINYFGLKNMEEKSFSANTVPHTIALRHELIMQFKKEQTLTVAIVGGGPSGVELAGSINMFAHKIAKKYNKKYFQPRVVLIEGGARLLPVLSNSLSAKIENQLIKLGVELKLNTTVTSCATNKLLLNSGMLNTDIIVWTAGSRIADFYAENEKEFSFERGKVVVDEYLRAKSHNNIYIIGDNANTKYSGMAQTALHDAKYLSIQLNKRINGSKILKYKPRRPVYAVPAGESWAVYQSTKHKLSGYSAWLLRRRADLYIYKNFEPYKKAIKQWRHANRQAKY